MRGGTGLAFRIIVVLKFHVPLRNCKYFFVIRRNLVLQVTASLSRYGVQRHKQQLFVPFIWQHCHHHFELLYLPAASQQLASLAAARTSVTRHFHRALLWCCHNSLLTWFGIKFSCPNHFWSSVICGKCDKI